ncbi:outer membrane beta-barrel protein [Desulfococcaceae bacterium OttesenSCG-928-F15]|nr:outer membrane beta-barrel protein [Desulfococcaceae bacterium OttesenSCG-928-F15]
MKKFVGGFLMVLALAFVIMPGAALAQKQSGVYIAPRFVYGIVDMGQMQVVAPSGKFKMNDDTDSAYGGSFAVGYNFNPKFKVPMRAELEYSAFSKAEGKRTLRNADNAPTDTAWSKTKQDVGIQTLMVNFYYDEKTSTPLTPYLTAGVGIAILDSKATEDQFEPAFNIGHYARIHSPEETDVNFAWQVGLGLAYDFTPNFSMDIGYRYMDLGSAKTKKGISTSLLTGNQSPTGAYKKITDVTMHQFHMGARYTF